MTVRSLRCPAASPPPLAWGDFSAPAAAFPVRSIRKWSRHRGLTYWPPEAFLPLSRRLPRASITQLVAVHSHAWQTVAWLGACSTPIDRQWKGVADWVSTTTVNHGDVDSGFARR
ncbi:hypothetical protein PSPO01_02744 [Paraphaeosphaeria sporulosa]